jgi:hypothetical protein
MKSSIKVIFRFFIRCRQDGIIFNMLIDFLSFNMNIFTIFRNDRLFNKIFLDGIIFFLYIFIKDIIIKYC